MKNDATLYPGDLIYPGCGWRFRWMTPERGPTGRDGFYNVNYTFTLVKVAFLLSVDYDGPTPGYTHRAYVVSEDYTGPGYIVSENERR